MSKNVLTLFLLSVLLFSYSCAVKRVELPVYEGVDVREALASKNKISAIDTTFSITYENNDTVIKGDGIVFISRNGDLTMRIYSLGFLAFELISENGSIKSSRPLDNNKRVILTYGLRDCVFWWDMGDFEIEEQGNDYILKNLTRAVWIDKKTFFPVRQVIELEDGRELNISYENPEKTGDIWYPSKIRIELSRYTVTLKIKDISFILDAQAKVNSDRIDN
jgi:outer membrane lipoprotein-sorting protein